MKRSERTRHKELTDAWKRLQTAKTVAEQAAWFLDACTVYPPRSDRLRRCQIVACSRCGKNVFAPPVGAIPRMLFSHEDHFCSVTAIPYIYNDENDPTVRRWLLIWVSVA